MTPSYISVIGDDGLTHRLESATRDPGVAAAAWRSYSLSHYLLRSGELAKVMPGLLIRPLAASAGPADCVLCAAGWLI